MQAWSPSFRELSCSELCRWLFRCLKKGKRHVSTVYGKRFLQRARKLKISLCLQSSEATTEKSSLRSFIFAIIINHLLQATLSISKTWQKWLSKAQKALLKTQPFVMPRSIILFCWFFFFEASSYKENSAFRTEAVGEKAAGSDSQTTGYQLDLLPPPAISYLSGDSHTEVSRPSKFIR